MNSKAPASSPPVFPGDDDIEEDDNLDPEEDLIQDLDDADEMAEDDAGIDLFGDNFDRDYGKGDDQGYRGAYIDDDEEYHNTTSEVFNSLATLQSEGFSEVCSFEVYFVFPSFFFFLDLYLSSRLLLYPHLVY